MNTNDDQLNLNTRRALRKYKQLLAAFPAPGGGGAHTYIPKIGCLAFLAGLSEAQAIADIRKYMPLGTRYVPDNEIIIGVEQAYSYMVNRPTTSRAAKPAPKVAADALDKLLKAGNGATTEDIIARSPITLDWHPNESFRHHLDKLYTKDDLIFVGDDRVSGILGDSIRPRDEWIKELDKLRFCPWPKYIPNPLTGKSALRKSLNGTTMRGDACVASHRLVVVEHDHLSFADQLAFWMAVPLPVAALVFSGAKSIHGLVQVDCADTAEWKSEIEESLFPQFLTPLGCDPACKNASRLSRAPGHIRNDTGLCQRLIYLAPGGRAVSA